MIFKEHEKFERIFTVSESVYQGFMKTFNDRNPLHNEEAFALARGFKGKVMHGNILNGFLSYFIGECLPVKNVIIHSQEIKFQRPVYLDDEVKLEAVVSGVFESVNAVEFRFTFTNEERQSVAKGIIQIGLLS